mgnify:CR=1 FL=1
MSKKSYVKPEIKDFISPSLHGQITPMGFCQSGIEAAGEGSCTDGTGVIDVPEYDCGGGFRPAGNCPAGNSVRTCKVGTFA